MSKKKEGMMKKIYLVIPVIAVVCFVAGYAASSSFSFTGAYVQSDLASKAVDFINKYLLRGGTTAELVNTSDMGQLYKINVVINGPQGDIQAPVYITSDGKYMFINAPLDLEKSREFFESQQQAQQQTQEKNPASCEDVEKSDSPVLQAFVVSYCPFGLQMQRILAEIVKNIPELEQYIKVRYIGNVVNGEVVSMHGQKEAQENLRQICIREEQSDKYWDYIECFIKSGNSESCLQSAAIDTNELQSCMQNESRGLSYAQEDFGLEAAFDVSGSPTLILNGQHVSEFNFGGRTAEAVKTLLCCGFSEKPEFCNQELTTNQAATGFSAEYSGSGGSGNC